jgi:RNA polymerase sigma factor (sigma-70 family)
MAAAESLTRLVHHLRRRCCAGPTDGEMLDRFARHRDEAAFAELVGRHGRLVHGVARRHLPDRQAAEDVVQATFLALARNARRLGRPPSLANWLYTVAVRQSRTARVRFARQRALLARLPVPAAAPDPLAAVSGRELVTIIDEELTRLPATYRQPLLLCAVEGLSRDEAAVRLGWTLGAFRGRLERGRELLRKRLTARGLTVPAVLAGGLLATPAEALPAALVRAVVRAAVAVPATSGMLRMTIALVTVGGLCIGGGATFWSGGPGLHGPATPPAPAAAIPPPQPQQAAGVVDPNDPKFAGHFSGQVTGPDGKPLSGARIFLAPVKDPPDKLAVRAKTDAAGRFEFDAPDMTYTEFDGLPARRGFVLSATADGYGPDWIGSGWSHGRDKASEFTLQLDKDDVPIHGQFLDPDGRPLAGAIVRLTGLLIPLGRNLEAQLDRERTYSRLMEVGYDNSISLRLLSSLIPVSTETRTDANGRFTLSGLGRDRFAALNVSAPSVLNTDLRVMTRDAPNVATRPFADGETKHVIYGAGFTLKLERGRTISGVVRDRDSHEPIAGMWVGIGQHNVLPTRTKDENYPRDGVLSNQTVTDAKGRFTITGLYRLPAKQTVTAASALGMPYESAAVDADGDSPVVIECQRGIPFRLKVLDEQGRPVEAEVAYNDVLPNPYAPLPFCIPCRSPFSKAAKNADGTYRGFLVPGPGAVLVTTPSGPDYRPAYVDPKAFFAPGRTNWTAQERITEYGTRDAVNTSVGYLDQNDYAAVVLVNPAPGSGPLELSATVVRDRPRRVSLIDPDGNPVVGAEAVFHTGYRTQLRAASFPLTKLHPNRDRRIWFLKEDRRLIGFLAARGDGDAPYTVRMQPWGTVTGRLVDEHGKPVPLAFGEEPVVTSDPEGSNHCAFKLEENGQFRIHKLIPGLSYSCAEVYRRSGNLTALMFDKLILQPGEVRDLGDVPAKPAGDETPRAKSGD